MGKMYTDVKTWNPQVGCKYDCTYCRSSYKRLLHRVWACQGMKCDGCRDFLPHEHPDRLKIFPSKQFQTIWACAHGDITFEKPEFIRKVIAKANRHPDREFYWQSKNPVYFEQYLSFFSVRNTIILTTLETNRDEGYSIVSKAPLPTARYRAFRELDWERKIVTIEPIMDFDEDVLSSWVMEIVWIGYNSHPNVKLPEPSLSKTMKFITRIESARIEVSKKNNEIKQYCFKLQQSVLFNGFKRTELLWPRKRPTNGSPANASGCLIQPWQMLFVTD